MGKKGLGKEEWKSFSLDKRKAEPVMIWKRRNVDDEGQRYMEKN